MISVPHILLAAAAAVDCRKREVASDTRNDKLTTFIGAQSASTQVAINIVVGGDNDNAQHRFKESLINQIKGESHLIQSVLRVNKTLIG